MQIKFWAGASALTLAILGSAPSFAQDAPPHPASSTPTKNATEEDGRVDEIVVTATKRSENVQDVPLSVVAITGDALANRQINDPTDLGQLAPGLTFRQSANARGQGFALRGIGTSVWSDAIEQSVGAVVDGVPLARSGQATQDLVDIERVEVLRGPQGMLFGKNASAGVISIVTKRPIFKLGGEANISYASLNEIKGNVVVNLPVSDTLATRFVFSSTNSDGLVNNIFRNENLNGRDSKALRGKFLWKPSAKTSIYLITDWSRTRTLCCAWTMRSVGPGTTLGVRSATAGIVPGPNNRQIAADRPFFQNSETYGASLQIDTDFNFATLTSITAARRWKNKDNNDPDLLPFNYLDFNDGDSRVDQISQELRLTSPNTGPFEWIIGTYFDRVKTDTVTSQGGAFLFLPPPLFLGQRTALKIKNESAAVFGQASYRVGKLKLSLGARYTWDGLYVNMDRRVAPGALGDFVTGGFIGNLSREVRNENLSARGTLQYDFTDDVMTYATVARGYKGSGLNTLNATPSGQAVVPPEIPTTYEVGVRTRLFNGTTVFNVSGFYSTYKDFQAQIFDTSVTPAFFRVGSAGELRSKGVEVELNTRPWRNTVLSLSGAYIDSTFADFKNVNCYLGQPILPLGTPRTSDRQCILVSPTQALTNADGLPLPGQPKWTLNADLRQSWEVDSLRIDAGLTWSWRSKVNFSPNDDPNTIQGAYGLLGGNLSVGPQNNKWRLTVFARNLLEKRFVSVIFPSPVLAAAGDYAQYQTPDSNRIIGAGFNVKF